MTGELGPAGMQGASSRVACPRGDLRRPRVGYGRARSCESAWLQVRAPKWGCRPRYAARLRLPAGSGVTCATPWLLTPLWRWPLDFWHSVDVMTATATCLPHT